MNDCDLRSLENFPLFPNLIRLELIDNKLHGKTLHSLTNLQNLQSLSLGGNLINNYTDIEPL
jgi:Leucine-rich repeat (LRR) protein